jgi:hypothetical protein
MRNSLKTLATATTIFLTAGLAHPDLRAQPVRDRILDEVYVTLDNGRPTIHVSLTFPFRYLSNLSAFQARTKMRYSVVRGSAPIALIPLG